MNLLLIFETIVSFWLMMDALRRKASPIWLLIILLPFGELIYFFVVKIHDPELGGLRGILGLEKRESVSLAPLREALEESPSYANTLALAQALEEQGSYGEATEHFRRALDLDGGESKDALYGLGESLMGEARHAEAIPELERLIALDPSFRDYGAWAHLALALWQQGEREAVLERLEELVGISPRLSHRILYAYYLRQLDRREEAGEQLTLGLREYEEAPVFLQGRNEAWARKARQMLREIGVDENGLSRSPA